jgi:hypothetical protein
VTPGARKELDGLEPEEAAALLAERMQLDTVTAARMLASVVDVLCEEIRPAESRTCAMVTLCLGVPSARLCGNTGVKICFSCCDSHHCYNSTSLQPSAP